MSRDSNIGDKTEYSARTIYIPYRLVREENLEAIDKKLPDFFPGGVCMTTTTEAMAHYKIEGLVIKGSPDFNLLQELQELELVMKD
ncbi:uncharacterized protein FFB20_11738 [Fusarium fujikuroi]|nr:uncharacterized protein FFC1_03670 [Fusarium fujikuroi]SCO02866.1 uncharacterized protein FFB20_11738 [Fusarium fujikuroi]SCO03065.1 uncharacterized protein FFE2_10178 [Fusarium fujikuroi]SCO08190.1 uncharacterized protein FFM5_09293 [Fusarium fujikuroi]SCO32857.1 uncharacterized protein FFNC_03126 [Fusarium fujikuroi]